MATHKGSEGTIKVGSNAVAELLSYSITENVDLIETTNISDAARLYTTGKTSWGGEIATNWDEGDTAQSALTIGASVTLNVYPEGATGGDTYYTGSAKQLIKPVSVMALGSNTAVMVWPSFWISKPLTVSYSP